MLMPYMWKTSITIYFRDPYLGAALFFAFTRSANVHDVTEEQDHTRQDTHTGAEQAYSFSVVVMCATLFCVHFNYASSQKPKDAKA